MNLVYHINDLVNAEIRFNLKEKDVNMCSVWNNTLEKAGKDAVLEEKFATAERLFFEMNMPLEFICDVTKLPLDQVEKHLSVKKIFLLMKIKTNLVYLSIENNFIYF